MTDNIQESLYKAAQVIADRTVDKLKLDKTITAVIKSCENAETKKYIIEYNGGKLPAYAEGDAVYDIGNTVYVLVPEGNFENKKIIVGKGLSTNSEIEVVYSTEDNYTISSVNLITGSSNELYFNAEDNYTETSLYKHDQASSIIGIKEQEILSAIASADAIKLSGSFYTASLSKEFSKSNGEYGIIIKIKYEDNDTSDYISYIFSSNKNMTGNPLLYYTWSDQYEYYPSIQKDKLDYIEEICFYSKGFPEFEFPQKPNKYENMIWMKDLSIYKATEMPASGDYKLRVTCDKGYIFKQSLDTESMTLTAKLLYRNLNTLEDKASYYWFVEDPSVTITSDKYTSVGGIRWRQIETTNAKEITINSDSVKGYIQKYKCICRYGEKDVIELQYNFKIYNKNNNYIVELTATPERITLGKSDVNCKVVDFDGSIYPAKDFQYIWGYIESNGDTVIKNISSENTYEYWANKIDKYVIILCSVYKNNVFLGSDEIRIVKEDSLYNESYYVTIDNCNQIFQYDEAGISPCAASAKNIIEPLTLTCHLFDKDGTEITYNYDKEAKSRKKVVYSINWELPKENTLFKQPNADDSLLDNEEVNLQHYTFSIVDNYNPSYINNQIACHITYNGQVYSALTNFSFVKMGNNGTNGTEYVLKFNGDILLTNKDGSNKINLDDELNPVLYYKNTPVTESEIRTWSISGFMSDKINIDNNKWVNYGNTSSFDKTNLIIKYSRDGKYYGFYPMPLIEYANGATDNIVLSNRENMLTEVTYSSAGDYPQYNINHNFNKVFKNGENYITNWEANGEIKINNGIITPNQQYTGSTDNYICATLDSGTKIYIPIYMHYNTYELSSLNAWDGNSVDLGNDDKGYVLAPQIGAGTKNDQNQFTGILMGTQKSYTKDKDKPDIGLFGYSDGKRSIFLDADTGIATLGLPDTAGKGYIKLDPTNDSSIGKWIIGDSYLYNDNNEGLPERYGPGENGSEPAIPHDKEGIKLSADPAYLAIKGKPLKVRSQHETGWDIDNTSGKSDIQEGDSLEIELAPSERSLFTIWRHYQEVNETTQKKEWKRSRSVGIDSYGRFYTNSLKDDSGAALSLSNISAFGIAATTKKYKGLDLEIGSDVDHTTSFIKLFADSNNRVDGVKISTGNNINDEYEYPLSLHAKSISLYADDGESEHSKSTSTDTYLSIDDANIKVQREPINFALFSSSKTLIQHDEDKYIQIENSNVTVKDKNITLDASYLNSEEETVYGDIVINGHIGGNNNFYGIGYNLTYGRNNPKDNPPFENPVNGQIYIQIVN